MPKYYIRKVELELGGFPVYHIRSKSIHTYIGYLKDHVFVSEERENFEGDGTEAKYCRPATKEEVFIIQLGLF